MSATGSKRSRDEYMHCPHCEKEMNIKRFKEHERLYFNNESQVWVKDIDDDLSSLSDFDGFEALDNLDADIDHCNDNCHDNLNLEDSENEASGSEMLNSRQQHASISKDQGMFISFHNEVV